MSFKKKLIKHRLRCEFVSILSNLRNVIYGISKNDNTMFSETNFNKAVQWKIKEQTNIFLTVQEERFFMKGFHLKPHHLNNTEIKAI